MLEPCPHCGYCPTCGRRNRTPWAVHPPWGFEWDPPYTAHLGSTCVGNTCCSESNTNEEKPE